MSGEPKEEDGTAISREQAVSIAESLVGLRFRYLGRAAGMLWVGFGEMTFLPGRKGLRFLADWALHVDSDWRLIADSTVFIACGDMDFLPDGENRYDWNAGGKSLFDEKALRLSTELNETDVIVTEAGITQLNELQLQFSDGRRFETLGTHSSDTKDFELWRLFQPGKDAQHLVAEINRFSI